MERKNVVFLLCISEAPPDYSLFNDWREFFNKTSIVEKILLKDPSKTYENMDFESKDYYRHKIEKISRKYNIEEDKIAEKLVYLSKKEEKEKVNDYKKHIGYYLIDDGINELGKELGLRVNLSLLSSFSL